MVQPLKGGLSWRFPFSSYSVHGRLSGGSFASSAVGFLSYPGGLGPHIIGEPEMIVYQL